MLYFTCRISKDRLPAIFISQLVPLQLTINFILICLFGNGRKNPAFNSVFIKLHYFSQYFYPYLKSRYSFRK